MYGSSFELDRELLTGQVAVVTGASRGLGAGLADRFAHWGLAVGLCARTAPKAPEGADALAMVVDVAEAHEVESFAERVERELGPISIWVNNAGVLDPVGFQRDHDPELVSRSLLVNIGGVANGTRAFTRRARPVDGRRPTLINVSSGAATSVYQGWSIYGATKAAVDHFTDVVASEEPDIGCHAVSPGVVDTDMQALIRAQSADDFPTVARFSQIHAEGRWNSPGWIADHLLAIHTGLICPPAVKYRVPDQSGGTSR